MTTRHSKFKLTADQLAPDILHLLSAFQDKENSIRHEAVVMQVLKGACWWISNAQGKQFSCNTWSMHAWMRREENPEASWKELKLIHEHSVPRSVIAKSIFDLPEPSIEAIRALLALSSVCIVTDEENNRLPRTYLPLVTTNDHGGNLFERAAERYRLANITAFCPINHSGFYAPQGIE